MKKSDSFSESQSVNKRITREKKTVEVLIGMYCSRHHGGESHLCNECRQLLHYAWKRLEQCPFKLDKPTCAKCAVHCYKQDMREKIDEVMRFSGPRMIYHHPLLAFRHLTDGRRKPKGGKETWQENSNQPKL